MTVRRAAFAGRARIVLLTLVVAGAAAGAAVVVLGADGDSGKRSNTRQTVAASPNVLPTGKGDGAARAEDVESSYRAYWTAFLVASDPPVPTHPGLAQVATGRQLREAQRVLRVRQRNGEVLRGTYRHQIKVETLSADRATLVDCLEAHVAVSAPGSTRPPADTVPAASVSATLVRRKGFWMVARLTPGGAAC